MQLPLVIEPFSKNNFTTYIAGSQGFRAIIKMRSDQKKQKKMLSNNSFPVLKSRPTNGAVLTKTLHDPQKFEEDRMATEVGVRLPTTLTVEEAVQRLISTIDEEFDDIVTYAPLTRARTLPCGHNFNEPTIRQLSVDRQGNKTCPSCRAPFRHTAANTAIRNVVNARLAHQQAVSTNPSVEAMAQLERAALNSPSMEATAHYEKGKRFAAQGDFEQAIQGCLAAITLSPDFAKAHAYLHFLLDQQGRVPSVPQSSELVSTGAPNQDSERVCNRQTVGTRVTRSTGVEERGASPRRNPSLASRVSTQPAVHSSGLVDDFRQFFGSLYDLNMLAIQSIYSVTGADRACESAGEALGMRIREFSNRRGIV